jgi:four helix bundle protein
MKQYKNLMVWQKAFNQVLDCYKLTKGMPNEEKFGLISQINRASVSIVANIAEGNGRNSDGELNLFLGYANGSCFEIDTLISVVVKLEMCDIELANKIIDSNNEISKMLYAFQSKIKIK